jgi:hypothetical protein
VVFDALVTRVSVVFAVCNLAKDALFVDGKQFSKCRGSGSRAN